MDLLAEIMFEHVWTEIEIFDYSQNLFYLKYYKTTKLEIYCIIQICLFDFYHQYNVQKICHRFEFWGTENEFKK